MQNNKSLLYITISVLCLGIIGFLAWDLLGAGKDVGNPKEGAATVVAPTSTPAGTITEEKDSPVQDTIKVNNSKPSMTNENNPLTADATEVELVARIKVLLPQIAAYYSKEELTAAEQTALDALDAENKRLTELLEQKHPDGISAILQVNAYGYDAKVLINGSDVGITGGMSESLRLMNKEHYSYQLAAPNVLRLYVLKKGENTISITYSQKEGETAFSNSSLGFYLGREEILNIPLTGNSGSVEKTVTLGM